MFFRKKGELQQLKLEVPKPVDALPGGGPQPAPSVTCQDVDPAKLQAVRQKAKQILESGRIADSLFVCQTNHGLLLLQAPGKLGPILLLFSSPFAATDYLRATATAGKVGQIKLEMLPPAAQTWLSAGVENGALDRCPRCQQFLSFAMADMAKWTKEHLMQIWAHHRATRLVLGETRLRSAMNHLSAGSPAKARGDLEYIRDHFDCGIPYLHQMIGLLAGIGGDEPAKSASLERLKEFGPAFGGPLDFSPELLSVAMTGLMANFGILRQSAGSNSETV